MITLRGCDRLNYNLFKNWFESKPHRNPRVDITESLARQIAILVYDEEAKDGK